MYHLFKPFNHQINNHWLNTEAFSGQEHKSHQAVCQDVTGSEGCGCGLRDGASSSCSDMQRVLSCA